MLCTKTYTRAELVQIYGTSRLDALKKKLDREGYIYITSGRGNDLTLTITACTKPFNIFCKEVLGFSAQTDFDKLKGFLKRLFFDEAFASLPFAAMQRESGIASQTISKWINHLIEENMIALDMDDCIYYSTRKISKDDFETIFITQQEYKEAWKIYWENRPDGYCQAVCSMYNHLQGTPHKRAKIIENAFELERLNKLKELLKGD